MTSQSVTIKVNESFLFLACTLKEMGWQVCTCQLMSDNVNAVTWLGSWVEQTQWIGKVKCSFVPQGNLSTPISHPPSPGTPVVMVTIAKPGIYSHSCTHKHIKLLPGPQTVCGNVQRNTGFLMSFFRSILRWQYKNVKWWRRGAKRETNRSDH